MAVLLIIVGIVAFPGDYGKRGFAEKHRKRGSHGDTQSRRIALSLQIARPLQS